MIINYNNAHNASISISSQQTEPRDAYPLNGNDSNKKVLQKVTWSRKTKVLVGFERLTVV
jgi:hypothetical protein